MTGSPILDCKPTTVPSSDEEAIRRRVLDALPEDLKLPSGFTKGMVDVTKVPETCKLLTESELAITAMDATGVRDAVASGQLSAVEVVTAFGRRAAIAHQIVHCLTDFFLDAAIESAQHLDHIYRTTGKVVGPLHGVPVSIKDHINIKGRWGSNGFKSGISVAESDADMITLLRRLGAVLYVKTNQPQTIMHLECHSVYGRTLNPHNTALTPGGSSGGESSLIALGGSCLGVGTDGGGSIRAPAGHTGIYGYRPTTKTMPTNGYQFYMPGCDSFGISTGPMCTSARDIDLFMSAIRGTEPHLSDPGLFPQAWTPHADTKILRVGFMRHDGEVLPHPPTLRAFDAVIAKLGQSSEVQLFKFEPFKQKHGYDILRRLYFEDGGANIRSALAAGGEASLPLTDWLLDPDFTRHNDVWESWKVRNERDVYQQQYASHWRQSGIDVLLCPPFPGTAASHDSSRYWGYTAVYNLLDYPGIVFPSGLKADPSIDTLSERKSFMSTNDEVNHALYDPKVYEGAPIGLQLLAYRFDDCKLFAALARIRDILGLRQ